MIFWLYLSSEYEKTGILVFPKEVTILGSTRDLVQKKVHLEVSAHAQPVASNGTQEFISGDDFDKLSS